MFSRKDKTSLSPLIFEIFEDVSVPCLTKGHMKHSLFSRFEIRKLSFQLSKGLKSMTSGRSGGKLVFDCPILATEALWTSHEIFHEIFGLPSNTVLHAAEN